MRRPARPRGTVAHSGSASKNSFHNEALCRPAVLSQPAHLPVRDRNARGADEYETGDARDSEPAVRRMAAAPAAKRERAEDPADQAADVTADRDVAAARVVREADREVDHDERDRVAAEELSG